MDVKAKTQIKISVQSRASPRNFSARIVARENIEPKAPRHCASVLYIPRQPTVPHLALWRRSASKMAESNINIFCSLHPALIRILQNSCQSFYIINRINISISKFAHIVPPPRQIQIKGHVTNSHNIRNQNMNGMDSTTNTILPRYTANSTQ